MTDGRTAMGALLEVMARLRDRERGCPWDCAQTFATIAPYTLEEAYEVLDAVESGEPERLKDELGDLLFQVVFHARMAEERGWFEFADVARGIHDKLLRRHPHVFGEGARPREGSVELDRETNTQLWKQWEDQKERERSAAASRRGEADSSMLADVPRALPALTRAVKLGKRASRVGFDWLTAPDVRVKVAEELAELDAAFRQSPIPERGSAEAASPAVVEELGDLLFALANLGRHLRADPEAALRAANAKFERRFQYIEQKARERGRALRELSAADWEALWQEAKQSEATSRA
jgi:nucleoside triphosphate diphosphatase